MRFRSDFLFNAHDSPGALPSSSLAGVVAGQLIGRCLSAIGNIVISGSIEGTSNSRQHLTAIYAYCYLEHGLVPRPVVSAYVSDDLDW